MPEIDISGPFHMANNSKTTDRHSEASPWPILVALGLAISETGVFLGIRPMSVGGLLLFVGSVAGILQESGFIVRFGRAVGVQSVALIGIGVTLISVNQAGATVRGQSIIVAGAICLLAVSLGVAYTRME